MSDSSTDPVWERIREETARHASDEPILASFLHATILNHNDLESALSFHLANQLDSATASSLLLREVMLEAMEGDASIREAVRADLLAVEERGSRSSCSNKPMSCISWPEAPDGCIKSGRCEAASSNGSGKGCMNCSVKNSCRS